MLLAEIHGKRFPDAEGQEDWLTSAVFGNLRLVPPKYFWSHFFARARSVEAPSKAFSDELRSKGLVISDYSRLEIRFWEYYRDYGEPDLLLRFTGEDLLPLIVLIEVKLNSGKSSFGKDDQLKKYLELLDDREAMPHWNAELDHRYLLYLTRTFAKLDLKDSIEEYEKKNRHWKGLAEQKMFGVSWTDLLAAADQDATKSDKVEEVASFLHRRDFSAFHGFDTYSADHGGFMSFYSVEYFRLPFTYSLDEHDGKFYGR